MGSDAIAFWRDCLASAESSQVAWRSAVACARLAMLRTAEEDLVDSGRLLQRAQAWAQLAAPDPVLQALLRAASLQRYAAQRRTSEAERVAQALLTDSGFNELPPRLRFGAWKAMISLAFHAGQPAAIAPYARAALRAVAALPAPYRAESTWSAQTFAMGALLFSSAEFEARAMPWPQDPGLWLVSLRQLAAELDEH